MTLTKPVLSLLSPAGPKARLSVLIFHRVLAQQDPLFPEELDAQQFERVCQWISQWLNVLPLDDAVCRLRSGSLPSRAAAITFDDGYADNREVALPILQRYGLCATFFIATGFLDGGCMWNDVVIEAVRHSAAARLNLGALGIAAQQSVAVGSDGEKRAAIGMIVAGLKYLPEKQRREAATWIARAAGVAQPTKIMMTSRQIVEMHRAGMQIGAHTVTHPILGTLDRVDARAEMLQSKRYLEELLEDPVPLFAYPNGKPQIDFTDESSAIVR
ncbi:MAG: polysaccharide deacetylase family protein, partial [Bryocella sp.]